MSLTEQELVSRCKRADEEALELLFKKSAPFLFGICRRYLAGDNEAKDVFQDGFVKIIEGIGRFEYRGEGSLKAWMSRVMINQALNQLKINRNSPVKSGILVEDPSVEMSDIDEKELKQVSGSVLKGFLMQLPDDYRIIFNMYVFEDLSHKEIASILGITETASSTKLYRAKRMLAEMIRKYRKQ